MSLWVPSESLDFSIQKNPMNSLVFQASGGPAFVTQIIRSPSTTKIS